MAKPTEEPQQQAQYDGVQSARVLIEVTAGLVPGQEMGEYRRLYAVLSDDWNTSANPPALLAEKNGEAAGYAMMLMNRPDQVNWVKTDWLWL